MQFGGAPWPAELPFMRAGQLDSPGGAPLPPAMLAQQPRDSAPAAESQHSQLPAAVQHMALDRWAHARAEDQVAWEQRRALQRQQWLLQQAQRQREFELQQAEELARWEEHRELQQQLWQRWVARQRREWEQRGGEDASHKRLHAVDDEADSAVSAPAAKQRRHAEPAASQAPTASTAPPTAETSKAACAAASGEGVLQKAKELGLLGPDMGAALSSGRQASWEVLQPPSPPQVPEQQPWAQQHTPPQQDGSMELPPPAGLPPRAQQPAARRSSDRAKLAARQRQWCEAAQDLLSQLQAQPRLSTAQVQTWKEQCQWLMAQKAAWEATAPPGTLGALEPPEELLPLLAEEAWQGASPAGLLDAAGGGGGDEWWLQSLMLG